MLGGFGAVGGEAVEDLKRQGGSDGLTAVALTYSRLRAVVVAPDSDGRWPEKQQIEDSEDAKKKRQTWRERERGGETCSAALCNLCYMCCTVVICKCYFVNYYLFHLLIVNFLFKKIK